MSSNMVPAQELTVDIESPAAGGSSIARHEGQVIFVSGALPGERVRIRTEAGPPAKFLRASVTEVLEASDDRVPDRRLDYLARPDGEQVRFGGMEYAHVDLAASRVLKAEVLGDQLGRIGGIDREVDVRAAPGESTGTNWRTRVQLAVDDAGRPGMLAARSHEVVPVTSAPLAVDAIAEVELSHLRLPGVRRLEFAWSGRSGALIVRGQADPVALEALVTALGEQWSILAEAPAPHSGVQGRGAGSGAKTRGGRNRRVLKIRDGVQSHAQLRTVRGANALTETVDGRDFRVAADGFWQVHCRAAALLSAEVNAALPDGATAITDLYCGVGLLGIGAAHATGASLHGIEGVPTAIENAEHNAAGLDARFLARSVDGAPLPDSEVIILDPPRAGAGKKVTSALVESTARTLIYVSCDAATLARDLSRLRSGGFAIERLTGFDLFPLTSHLETVAVLRR